MSHIIEIELPESVHESLIKKAKSSGLTAENLAKELITAAVKETSNDPIENFIGAFDSQGSDWVDQHDHYIGKSAIETD